MTKRRQQKIKMTNTQSNEAPVVTDFIEFKQNLPQQITDVSDDFLYWFIGFVEGDGSYIARKSDPQERFSRGDFEICQKTSEVLYFIRKNLGFGQVEYRKDDDFWTWRTSKSEHIVRLIQILNGKLLLEKRRTKFISWVEYLNKEWAVKGEKMEPITIKPWTHEFSLNNAWLSGFTDADGGFNTNATRGFFRERYKNGSTRYGYKLIFYITQKGEDALFEKMAACIPDCRIEHKHRRAAKPKAPENIQTETSNVPQEVSEAQTSPKPEQLYNRFEVNTITGRIALIKYFEKYPLHLQTRHIDYLRWVRVHGYQQRGYSLTARSARKLANLLLALSEKDLHRDIQTDIQEVTTSLTTDPTESIDEVED